MENNVIDFIHYAKTEEIQYIAPCEAGTHNPRNVGVYGANDVAIIKCNYCDVAIIPLDGDDYFRFIDGNDKTRPKCHKPFHLDELIVPSGKGTHQCRGCGVEVTHISHPSFEGKRWYG